MGTKEEVTVRSCNQVIAVAESAIQPEDGELLNLKYSLRCLTGPSGDTLYGLQVDKRHPNGHLIEREETHGLTSSIDEATALAKVFAAGTVPPCVLLEMVDEWHDVYCSPAL